MHERTREEGQFTSLMVAIIFPVSTANPAPLIAALVASHMLTTIIFFNRNSTLRASLSTFHRSPSFIKFSFSFFTALPFVPCDSTLKAKRLVALMTDDFFGPWLGFHFYIYAFRIRAKFSVSRFNDLVLTPEP